MITMSLAQAALAMQVPFSGEDVVFTGCSTDSRVIDSDNLFIALKGDRFNGHDYTSMAEQKGAAALLLEDAVPHKIAALKVDNTRRAMGLLARCWRDEITIPVVAITGSNGKTTVKEMVASVLSKLAPVQVTAGNLNNDIGVPLTLFGLDQKHQYAVIEMGANHLGEIAWLSEITHPSIAVITQCAPAHLEGFGSIDGVAAAKAEIYSGLSETGIAIINADDDYADFWQHICGSQKRLTFGIETTTANVCAHRIRLLQTDGGAQFELVTPIGSIEIELSLSGRHNIMNALAAAACCLGLDIALPAIKNGLESMRPVAGRLQIKPGKNGSTIIDDSYNANPTSLDAALMVLAAYKGQRYLVLGDMNELGEQAISAHRAAGQAANKMGIDGLWTIGALSGEASSAYGDGALHFDSYVALNQSLLKVLNKETTILIKGSRAMKMEQCVQQLTEEQS